MAGYKSRVSLQFLDAMYWVELLSRKQSYMEEYQSCHDPKKEGGSPNTVA
jgi:hypothetical protein